MILLYSKFLVWVDNMSTAVAWRIWFNSDVDTIFSSFPITFITRLWRFFLIFLTLCPLSPLIFIDISISVQRFLNTYSGIVPGDPFLRGEYSMLPYLTYQLRVWRESFTPYPPSIWSHKFWADLPLGFFISSSRMVVARLCASLAHFLSIAAFARCCCMPVVVFQICFIFGRANLTASGGVDRDDIKLSMEIV